MAYYNKNKQYQADGSSAESKALDTFAELMIEKIQSLQDGQSWQKPWFTESALRIPKNLSGREYNGMNSLMLMMHGEKNKYELPIYVTFDRVMALNYQKDKQGMRSAMLDANGEHLPHVGVNKGEKSFPVFLTTFTCIDKETKNRISYDDYKQMSNDEKQGVNVYPKQKVYCVFNVAQTNINVARPELYNKLLEENKINKPNGNGEHFSFPPMDKMIEDQSWVCPINIIHQDAAFYSISKDAITFPEKSQFKDGESFYSNLWHEMAHSTGSEKQLNRLNPNSGFGSDEYSKEELTAELSAALVATKYQLTKGLKTDSAMYLKSWLDNLKQSPDYIKTVLMDVKKASGIIIEKIDAVKEKLDNKVEEQETNAVEKEPIFYASVNYLQMADDTHIFDKMQDSQDYNGMIMEAAEYDNGDSINLSHTYTSSCRYPTDVVLAEDENYAVVYNPSVGGTYDIMRKVTQQDVRDAIQRYGLFEDATDDVKDVAKAMVSEEFSKMMNTHIPAFEMPSGDILYIQYNQDKNTLDIGSATNIGMTVMHSFPYDHNFSLDANLEGASEKLSEMPVYQAESEQEPCVAEQSPSLNNSVFENREALDTFMKEYWGARRDKGFMMCGFETYNGKEAIILENENFTNSTYYLISRDASEGKDKYFMHLYDSDLDKEVFTSREMPQDKESAYSFMRGAYRELEDYEHDKQQDKVQDQQEEADEEQHFRRGR